MRDGIPAPHNPGRLVRLIGGMVFLVIVVCTSLLAIPAATPASAQSLQVPAGLVSPNYFGPKIDDIQSYEPQTGCNDTDQVGVVGFQKLLLKTFPQTGDYGISTPCDGSLSEHHEGRAWDWKVSASSASDVQTVKTVLNWLFAKDKYGNQYAMARRLGVMYIIWNNQFWSIYNASQGWISYDGSNPHTDHVHFSFFWSGALEKTTYWHPENSCNGTAKPTATSACGDVSPTPAATPTKKASPTATPSPTKTVEGERRPLSLAAVLILIPEHKISKMQR